MISSQAGGIPSIIVVHYELVSWECAVLDIMFIWTVTDSLLVGPKPGGGIGCHMGSANRLMVVCFFLLAVSESGEPTALGTEFKLTTTNPSCFWYNHVSKTSIP